MTLGHTSLFQKRFCTVYFAAKDKNEFILPTSAQRKYTFSGVIKEIPKIKKMPSRMKSDLYLLHQILGHISTISYFG